MASRSRPKRGLGSSQRTWSPWRPHPLTPQEKELYLLDDPLAAVDADVATHLLHRCILGALSHTTRLLCTHRTEYLEQADVVLLLEAGRLVRAGNVGGQDGREPGRVREPPARVRQVDHRGEGRPSALCMCWVPSSSCLTGGPLLTSQNWCEGRRAGGKGAMHLGLGAWGNLEAPGLLRAV